MTCGSSRRSSRRRVLSLLSILLSGVLSTIFCVSGSNCHAASTINTIINPPSHARRNARKKFHSTFLLRGGGAAAVATTTSSTTASSSKTSSKPSLSLPTWSNKIIAGGTSRALAQALLYPIDALRTLAQTRDGRTLSDVGTKALLRGCAQTSSFALFTGAFQFGIFGLVNPKYGPLVASAAGAAGSCLVSVPQEVIKQRLVTGVYGSFREAVSMIWKAEGLAGFYSAWKPTVSRNVPFVVTTFTSRDVLKGKIVKYKERQRLRQRNDPTEGGGAGASSPVVVLTPLENIGIGIASALMAGVLTQPIDVVKTRMMTQAASTAMPYTSALDCASSILRTEGWKKLYSGFGQRSIYMCGLWGITFGLEPLMTSYLDEKKNK
mmetsp:Transcript_15133/g.27022  ORF Transcript_15133/g.27022 Transcript_15133/m.27022 type:complete len:379 (+) Transcript_15133:3-1139(+)